MQQKVTAQIGATQISIDTGKIAKLADGAVVVSCGDTMVLASAVSATTIKEGQDYFPLTVDYREKAAAVGKFPGGYFKREGRPSEKETLTSRMIDRPLRPLFPTGYFYDTQVISLLLSADGENDPDILALNGASAALCVSDIPFAGPIGAVRIGRVNGQFVANPTHAEREQSDLDLIYVGTENDIIMIEGAAREVPDIASVRLRAEESVPHQRSGQAETCRWPELSRTAPDLVRDRRSAPRAWFGDLSARRNPGAGSCYTRADRRSADDRCLWRRRT